MAVTALLMKCPPDEGAVEPAPAVDFGSEPRTFAKPVTTAALVQLNPAFGYRLVVSPDWELLGRQQDAVLQKQSTLVMNLPPVWSDVERQSIKNAISVFTKSGVAKDQDEAVAYFMATQGAQAIDLKPVEARQGAGFEYGAEDGGPRYALRTDVLFRHGVVYFITLTATPGTLAKNLPLFLAFAESVEFFEPRME